MKLWASGVLLTCPGGHRWDLGGHWPLPAVGGVLTCPKCGGRLLTPVALQPLRREERGRLRRALLFGAALVGLVVFCPIAGSIRMNRVDVVKVIAVPRSEQWFVSYNRTRPADDALFDANSGQDLFDLPAQHGPTTSMTFTHDGRTLALIDERPDNMVGQGNYPPPISVVSVYDVAGRKEVATLHTTGGAFLFVAFLRDGKTLLTVQSDGRVTWWDWRAGEEQRSLALPFGFTCLALSPDDETLAAGGEHGTVTLYDAGTLTVRGKARPNTKRVVALAFAPAGRSLAVLTAVDPNVYFLDPTTATPQARLSVPLDWLTCLTFSPDGQRVVVGGGNYRRPGAVKVYDRGDLGELQSFEVSTNTVTTVAVSWDGSRLAAGTRPAMSLLPLPGRGGWYQWDLMTGQKLASRE